MGRRSTKKEPEVGAPAGSNAAKIAADAQSTADLKHRRLQKRFELAGSSLSDPAAAKAEALLKKQLGSYDPQTGALGCDVINFHGKHPRGFGKTEEDDEHPFLAAKIIVIVAPTGGGKSNLLLNLLKIAMEHIDPKRLGRVIFFTGSPQDKLVQKLNPETVKIFSSQSLESFIAEILDLEKCAEIAAQVACDDDTKKPLNYILLDDIGNSRELAPERTKGSDIGRLYMRHRHLPACIMLTAQRWHMLPTFVRENARQVFLFPGASKRELDDIIRTTPFLPESVEQAYRLVRDHPHDFIWIDKENGTIKKNFSTVVCR